MTPPDEHASDETAPRRGWPQDWGHDQWGSTWGGPAGSAPAGDDEHGQSSPEQRTPPVPQAQPGPQQPQPEQYGPPAPPAQPGGPGPYGPGPQQQPPFTPQPSYAPQSAPYASPPSYGQPAPYGQSAPYGHSAAYGGPPATPRRGRARRVWLIVGLAVALVAGLTIGGLALFRSDDPALTFDGRAMANADGILSSTEQAVRKVADSRHGATNANTRCYFTQPSSPPSGGKASDVGDALLCGPVLFVDGVSDKAYLSYALSGGEPADGKVTVSAASQATDPNPATVPRDLTLVRPDGRTAPGGAGGLRVPDPPRADKDLFAPQDLGTATLPAAPATARLVSRRSGVTVSNLGPLTRYGAGDSARSAPEGQKMLGFVLASLDGEYAGDPFSSLKLSVSVNGGTGRALPAGASAAKPYVIAYPDSAASVDLVTSDSGFVQRISLLSGRPGSKNIALLSRTRRSNALNLKVNFNYQLSDPSLTAPWPATAQASRAYLYFWLGSGASATHPSSPTSAFLYVDATYTYTTPVPSGFTGTGGGPYGFRTEFCSLVTSSGRKYPAVNRTQVAGKIFNVFEVPATFTSGQLVVSGAYTNPNNVTLSVPTPLRLAITVPN